MDLSSVTRAGELIGHSGAEFMRHSDNQVFKNRGPFNAWAFGSGMNIQ
jgi:hypothetical protein